MDNRISESEYRDVDGMPCVTFADVRSAHGEELAKEFVQWMRGQTVAVMPETGESAIYAWDYERWCDGGRVTD